MKKVIFVAAAMTLGLGTSAWAAESCGAAPTAPALPDAATAKPAEVNATSKLIESYATDMGKWQSCMSGMVKSEVQKSNTIIDDYTKLVAAVKERTGKK